MGKGGRGWLVGVVHTIDWGSCMDVLDKVTHGIEEPRMRAEKKVWFQSWRFVEKYQGHNMGQEMVPSSVGCH